MAMVGDIKHKPRTEHDIFARKTVDGDVGMAIRANWTFDVGDGDGAIH